MIAFGLSWNSPSSKVAPCLINKFVISKFLDFAAKYKTGRLLPEPTLMFAPFSSNSYSYEDKN